MAHFACTAVGASNETAIIEEATEAKRRVRIMLNINAATGSTICAKSVLVVNKYPEISIG
ncbi:MAG TPA: hypothetical protein PLF40_14670 [Kofleriaceae bacterium]|nr:hypothetical protein [Kofleriaceae bacterium]